MVIVSNALTNLVPMVVMALAVAVAVAQVLEARVGAVGVVSHRLV